MTIPRRLPIITSNIIISLIVLWLLSYHPTIQKKVVTAVATAFERECNVLLQYQKGTFNLIPGTVVFETTQVNEVLTNVPMVNAISCTLKIAALVSLFSKKFIFDSIINGMHVRVVPQQDGTIPAIGFFKTLLSSRNDKIVARGLTIKNLFLENQNGCFAQFPGNIILSKDLNTETKKFLIHSHGINLKTETGLEVFNGVARMAYDQQVNSLHVGTLSLDMKLAHGISHLFMDVYNKHDRWLGVVRKGKTILSAVQYANNMVRHASILPLEDCISVADSLLPNKKLREKYPLYFPVLAQGRAALHIKGSYSHLTKTGSSQLFVTHKNAQKNMCRLKSVIHINKENRCFIKGAVHLNKLLTLKGIASFNPATRQLSCAATNNKPITLPTTFNGTNIINKYGIRLLCKRTVEGTVFGNVHLKDLASLAHLHYDGAHVTIHGATPHHRAIIKGEVSPQPRITSCTINDLKNVPLAQGTTDATLPHILHLTIFPYAIYSCIPDHTKKMFSGTLNNIECLIDQSHLPEKLALNCYTEKNNIGLVGSYNCVSDARLGALVNFSTHAAKIVNATISCASGSIDIKDASLAWNPGNGIASWKLPCTIHNLFINRSKDFYALVDGNCTFNWAQHGKRSIESNVILKKSFVNHTFPSSAPSHANARSFLARLLAKTVDKQGINVNVAIATQDPIIINTALWKTCAHVNARLEGQLQETGLAQPLLAGTIRLDGGTIEFLGRELRITRGTLDVLANQPDEPFIDFVAHTHIKRYRITIHVTGALRRPTILLESNPPLSQEQIMGLFLSGTEHADINQQLPGIFMQNVHKLFHPSFEQENTSLLQSIIKPLKYVQLLPYQDGASSSKTVKARLNVNLGPNLRALIHKDILGDDAVSLQVEYDISDEFNLKVLRQATGELGAEAEVRFKF